MAATPKPTKKAAPYKVEWERALFRRSKLKPTSVLAVLATYATYASPDGTNIRPTVATIAKGLGISEETVRKAVRIGLRTGWLIRVSEGANGRAPVYRLNIPDQPTTPDRDADGSAAGGSARPTRTAKTTGPV